MIPWLRATHAMLDPETISRFRAQSFKTLVALLWSVFLPSLVGLAEQQSTKPIDTAGDFFEQRVRPILIRRCGNCHGAKKQEGGLRVDSLVGLLSGGQTAPAIVPGSAEKSLLLRAIQRDGDLEMPPDEELPPTEIRAIQHWIDSGARWPGSRGIPEATILSEGENHWAFQPVAPAAIPARRDWVRTPVDGFVLHELTTHDLTPSPVADRRTLIRRVTYGLTGLPPAGSDVADFVQDPDPFAYDKLVERLLGSPQYGEQWGRHWLDVARYSDTKGYVYAREERVWTHAWSYRDWVVKALNADMRYDRFLLLQLAADQVADRETGDLAAMGFLTLGRRFLGVRRDVIDDRIDVVCRGTMGLTVSCARCHDHKYDPIPTADYYSLYGVFDSCIEDQKILSQLPNDKDFRAELSKRQTALTTRLREAKHEAFARTRERIGDYLFAQSQLDRFPANGFDQIFEESDLLPAFVRQWERYLRATLPGSAKGSTEVLQADPVFGVWHAYRRRFSSTRASIPGSTTPARITANPLVAAAFEKPPRSFREVCDLYGQLFAQVDADWRSAVQSAEQAGQAEPMALDDPHAEALRQVLYGVGTPCRVPEGPISHTETFFDSATCTELWKLQGEVDRWLIQTPHPLPVALTLVDQATPKEPRIFRRGDPLKLGADVPRQFLSVLSGTNREPFRIGSGRRELALSIINAENPLTARVMVNRVWAHHFGKGLVPTPSDFGLRADPPSHPELLDWLAAEFIRSGWSLKQLHRLIVLSATYRQDSAMPSDSRVRARVLQVDPQNRLLSRMNSRRLTFEEVRDSLLRATGDLDYRVGGKPTDLFARPFPLRRTLYGQVDRQYFPSILRMFDFANPDLHVPQRIETTVPQQALFFMNHPLVLERARALAGKMSGRQPPTAAITRLFQRTLQRAPGKDELRDARSLLATAKGSLSGDRSNTEGRWHYGYGAIEGDGDRVIHFTPLPHFTGEAWQGGNALPDSKLGWVQLTASGGHPGNDHQHAAIRRWIAPRSMTVSIRSHLVHEPEAGDGIRAHIISSRSGQLYSTTLHHAQRRADIESVDVRQGEAIDFVVDIAEVLNNDQFLWTVTLTPTAESAVSADVVWDSKQGFSSSGEAVLDAWERLAQVLLCTNEFLFLD